MSTLATVFNTTRNFRVIYRQKKLKDIQIGKEEVKLSRFADGMILYIENNKKSTKNLYRIQVHYKKSILYLYTVTTL